MLRFYRGEFQGGLVPSLLAIATRLMKGFSANVQRDDWTVEDVINHIINGTLDSPFISVTTSRVIAERYATTQGVVYAIQLTDDAVLINPVSVITDWMVTNNILSGDAYERAQEAILMAGADLEWLVLRHIPRGGIKSLELLNPLGLLSQFL